MTKDEIEKLAEWTKPKELATKFGPRILRTAPVTEAFSAAWKTRKEEMKADGLSWRKDEKSGTWICCWWSKLDQTEVARREETKIKSTLAESDFQPTAPEGLSYRGFQRAGVEYALGAFKKFNGCIIGDEMGLGKTIQAIGCINTDPEIKRVLIVCPNTLKINWRNELRKWLVRPMRIGIQKAGDTYWGDHVDILIINFDIMAKYSQLTQSQWDMRVIDEAHYIKNPKAIRTKATLATWARRKLTMTGTPMENRPIELFTLINDIDPHRWPSRFGFAKRYCAAQHNGFGWDFDGSSNAEELQDALRSTIMIRRLKSQVLKELPPKQRQVIELPVESASGLVAKEEREWQIKQGRIDDLRVRIELAKANDDLLSYKAAVEALNDAQGVAFDEMAKLRYEIGMAKVERACDFITDALEGGKVIVFAHHLDVVHRLKKEFPQAAVVTGETKADQRQGEVERFQTKPECNVFIGNLAAAEGLTLTAADHVIFVEAQWVPGKLAQMEDRAHRIGQTENVLCSYLVLEGSLDARMLRACVDKLDVIDRTLDRQHDPLVYAEPPVIVAKGDRQPMTAKRERLVKLSEQITPEMIQEIHRGLQQLAGSDVDYAQEINGVGFSKIDVRIGHELANSPRLTRMQAALGAMLCNKYRGQLGEGCWTELLAKKTDGA